MRLIDADKLIGLLGVSDEDIIFGKYLKKHQPSRQSKSNTTMRTRVCGK